MNWLNTCSCSALYRKKIVAPPIRTRLTRRCLMKNREKRSISASMEFRSPPNFTAF